MAVKTMINLKQKFNDAASRIEQAHNTLHSEHPPEDDREALTQELKELAKKDLGTRIHVEKVAFYAYGLVQALGYDDDIAKFMRNAVKLHDTGKNTMPVELLYNARQLSDHEFEQIKMHTVDGANRLLDASEGSLGVFSAEIALYHHERLDGSGYHGLQGDEIPWHAKITAIADTFEAMTNETRSYQDALSAEEALEKMQADQDRTNNEFFDDEIFQAFKKVAVDLYNKGKEIVPESLSEKAKTETNIRSHMYGMRKPS